MRGRFPHLRQHHGGALIGHRHEFMRAFPFPALVSLGSDEGIRQHKRQPPSREAVSRILVGVPDLGNAVLQLAERCRLALGGHTQERGELPVVHQRRPKRRHCPAPALRRPLHQGRLGKQVAKGHVQRIGQRLDHREPVQLQPVVLGLAQPVDRPAHQTSQDFLGHAASAPVPSNSLTDRQVRRHSSHGKSVPCLVARPRSVFPGW